MKPMKFKGPAHRSDVCFGDIAITINDVITGPDSLLEYLATRSDFEPVEVATSAGDSKKDQVTHGTTDS